METRIETMRLAVGTFPDKCLETAADLAFLLQHRHLESVPRQYDSTFQAAESTADNYRTSHFSINVLQPCCENASIS